MGDSLLSPDMFQNVKQYISMRQSLLATAIWSESADTSFGKNADLDTWYASCTCPFTENACACCVVSIYFVRRLDCLEPLLCCDPFFCPLSGYRDPIMYAPVHVEKMCTVGCTT